MPNITNPVLPPADSPSLVLAHPTAIEKRHIDTITGEAWKGRLTTEGYIRRVQHLQEQSLTRGGGLVVWVLVDTADIPPTAAAPRRILASCEIFRRRALIKSRSGEVEEVTSHSIGTVFCEAQYRRRGYTRRMMSELGKQLDTQQKDQRSKASFSVLYSDVGKVSRLQIKDFDAQLIGEIEILQRNGMATISIESYLPISCHRV